MYKMTHLFNRNSYNLFDVKKVKQQEKHTQVVPTSKSK